jgi:hypothetical protein
VNNSTLFVSKFDMRTGKFAWGHQLESKYGYSCDYSATISDTINNRVYVAGSATMKKNTNASAATLWTLNDSGAVIDTFYDKGSYANHNLMNDLVLKANGDLLMTGTVSNADYQAGVLYKYRYGYVPPVSSLNPAEQNRESIKTYPNPFTDIINVSYNLAKSETVSIELLEAASGRIIKTYPPQTEPEGSHITQLDLHTFMPGIYLVRMKAGNELKYGKVTKM